MRTIDIKLIHPTNNSDIDIGCPENILLRDVFSQLIDASFLASGQKYTAVLKPNSAEKDSCILDNDKTIRENHINDSDTIQIIVATQAGGGIEYFTDLWQIVYPYLDQIGTVLGLAGATVGFGVWVKSKFGKVYTPRQFTEIITEKEFWNAHELAIKLEITDEESKNLLKGFGYKWDNHFSLYYKTDKTIEILEKIQKNGA